MLAEKPKARTQGFSPLKIRPSFLKVHSERCLPGSVACILRCLWSTQYTERRRAVHHRRRRREVRVVQHVRKRRLKPRMNPLRHGEGLRDAKAYRRRRSRTLQDTYTRIPETSRASRCCRERRQVEVLRPRLPGIVVGRHHIRTQDRTTVRDVRIRLVVRRTDTRRQPRGPSPAS